MRKLLNLLIATLALGVASCNKTLIPTDENSENLKLKASSATITNEWRQNPYKLNVI